jgi:hypothetical protein
LRQSVSLVTLGVSHYDRAKRFYEALETFYGGYAGAFRDPDGHAWEIAHNPGFGLNEDGSVTLPSDRS